MVEVCAPAACLLLISGANVRRWTQYPEEHDSPLLNPLGLPEPRLTKTGVRYN
jgi:hypothetical protein